MSVEHQLNDLLRNSTRPLTVKQLKKNKVGTVQAIERSQFLELISKIHSPEAKDAAWKP